MSGRTPVLHRACNLPIWMLGEKSELDNGAASPRAKLPTFKKDGTLRHHSDTHNMGESLRCDEGAALRLARALGGWR